MHRCEVSSAAGVGEAGDRYDVVGKRGEKACLQRCNGSRAGSKDSFGEVPGILWENCSFSR